MDRLVLCPTAVQLPRRFGRESPQRFDNRRCICNNYGHGYPGGISMVIRCLGAVLALLLLSGCASVVRGTTEKVVVNSQPVDATIRTSLGHYCPTSPCTIEVSRKTPLTAYAEKEGYKPGSLYIGTEMKGGGAAGIAGNVILGGIIGIGVDAMSGAALDHVPNPALIILAPIDSVDESTKAVVPPPAPAKSNADTS